AQKLTRQIARLTGLTESLLDVGRLGSNRLTLHKVAFDLAALVREIVTRMNDERARQLITVESQETLGLWDRSRVDQIVSNLLSNAIKYGAGRTVHVTVEPTDDLARLTVSDHGIGISGTDQKRIFEQFERGASSERF